LEILEELGYADQEGLVTTDTDLESGPRDYIWRDLRVKIGLDAAFFSDGVPLIGFTGDDTPQGLAGIRRRLWNYGRVPVLISAGPEGTRAYNAVSYSNREESAEDRLSEAASKTEQLSIALQLSEAFRRTDMESGAFASVHSNSYRNSERVDAALLNNLQYLRTTSSQRGTLQRSAIDALIGGSLTATYLSQRGILTPDYLSTITEYADIYELLASGAHASQQLFEGLADHFNGDVFGPLPDLVRLIDEPVFLRISSLLQGDDLATSQRSLWPYDFSVLPADLVSSIYEQLLEETRQVDSAYYTPRFLVNTLLDETLAWDGVELPKIIDLACGSGAFMTEAFRRLCYREQRRVGRDLSYEELQGILRGHIFGVDSNPVAARTAVFGLYLGLLEQLDPPTIWESALLPTLLGSNVVVADAFDSHSLADQRFDVVVGNPPWQSSLTKPAEKFVEEHKVPVADKQLASAFLWLGAQMLQPGGMLGLVMPAKPLLHNRSDKAEHFRSEVFGKLNVRVLVELSAVRRQVFRNAIAPAAIIVASSLDQEISPEAVLGRSEILYVAAHPRPLMGAVDALPIAPEEIRGISQKQAEARPDLWSTLLWGSTRDVEFLDRLRIDFPTLGKIVGDRNWARGQGYQVGGGDENDATQLFGLPIIPTDAVQPMYLSEIQLETFARPYLHRPRDIRLFKAPHILIRRTVAHGRIAAVLVENDAVFANGVIGISGPPEDRPLLATIAAVLSSSLNCYWQFMTSASWGTERDFVELNEYLSLPIALPRTTNQAQEFLRESRTARTAQGLPPSALDEMVFDLYRLGEAERERIRNFMTSDFPRFRNPRLLYSASASDEWLQYYGTVVSEALSATLLDVTVQSVVSRQDNYCTVAITVRDSSATDTEPAPPVTVDIDQIGRARRNNDGRESTGIFALPAGFFINHDTIYIVKTADSDRWSRDAALNDADRIFAALAFGR
jgi:hypothetical protein